MKKITLMPDASFYCRRQPDRWRNLGQTVEVEYQPLIFTRIHFRIHCARFKMLTMNTGYILDLIIFKKDGPTFEVSIISKIKTAH